ncbi:MAG: tRNA (cytidine(34)-2'-O)-methyltransferase [Myxococcaceae bacterium]|nr:tRNA (cytidine(34)-2'-O)-methyltransferase [Myxococcaceae bacterium]
MLRPLSSPLHLVLVAPQIPPNTGNVARLCAVTGCRLILVEPLGFSISDRELKRAGLDYWDKVFLDLFPSWEAYLARFPQARRFLFTARSGTPHWNIRYREGDHLVFGSETSGLGQAILGGGFGEVTCIPMVEGVRSLNLSTAVGIATYEALGQLTGGRPGT